MEFSGGRYSLGVTSHRPKQASYSMKGPFEIKGTKWGNIYQVEVNKKVKTYHINILKLYVERGRIEETATPGRRDISGKPRGET